ncbi:hypothetical protein C2S51_027019 [Perilla frutescens var. frutescens]|nr:hypothetical protein C2S51_027019 [Perilla frutescens var. frutescens]
MPAAIFTKLSPLSKQDSDYYAKTISQINFKADTKFCSLAKLACSASLDLIYHLDSPPTKKTPTARVYNEYAAPSTGANQAKATTSQEKMDPFSFFRSSNLKEGDTIHLSSLQESLAQRAFLPPHIASKLSLTLKSLTKLFPHSSKGAIETTFSYCNAAPIKGELKSCPKSLEEMINFSKITLKASKLLALTSKTTEGSDRVLMIEKVKQFDVEKFVACHENFLPFATYYCHSLPSSQIYAVDLIEPTTRTPVNTVLAVCHMDTSSWPEEHVAFKILKFRPGQGEACHWLDEIDLVWISDGDNI